MKATVAFQALYHKYFLHQFKELEIFRRQTLMELKQIPNYLALLRTTKEGKIKYDRSGLTLTLQALLRIL